MSSKVTDLTSTPAYNEDEIYVNRAGADRKATLASVAALAKGSAYRVNDFYPAGVAAPTGTSRPLSGFFASLAEAQAVYPKAAALTDEIDWCAWQKCIDTAYANDYYAPANVSTARILADGKYVVNRTIEVYLYQVEIDGINQPSNFNVGAITSIKYNGPAGTIDDPAFILDFNAGDEQGNSVVAGVPETAGGSAGYCRIRNMGFVGKNGALAIMQGHPSGTDYVVGIRLRFCNFGEIARCSFFNGLYDGIRIGLSMFSQIHNNFFYGVHRDCLTYYAIRGNFSTTIWIDENEFGYGGRYAICIDVTGAVQPSISCSRNDIEQTFNSYYNSRPEWWVHGVVAPMVLVGAGSPTCRLEDNRFEGVQFYDGIWADWHFAACSSIVCDNNMNFGTFITTHDNTGWRTQAGVDFITSRGYFDITDTRNYKVASPGSALSSNQQFVFRNSFGGVVFFASDYSWGSSGFPSRIENQSLFQLMVPAVDRPDLDGKMVGKATEVVPTMHPISKVELSGVDVSFGPNRMGAGTIYRYNTNSSRGDYVKSTLPWLTWASETACRADCNPNGGGSAVGLWTLRRKWVVPTVANGFVYECQQTGTTGVSEPTWPTTIGNTVTDGTVIWKCIYAYGLSGPWTATEESMMGGRRQVISNGSAPSSGRWEVGDMAWERIPTAGGNIGWVCTIAGTPGTWKPFGTIGA